MLARIHEEMMESISHLDIDTQDKVLGAFVRYQFYWTIPSPDDVLVYSVFMARKFDLDNIIRDVNASIENGKKGWRPHHTWDNSKKPKHNLKEPKHNLSETEQEQEQEHEQKQNKIYPPDFESFWKEFPHARKGKKWETFSYYSHLEPSSVLLEARHLKLKVMAGVQDSQFIPACERWMRDFTPTSDEVKVQDLERIMKWHMSTEWAKERYPLLVSIYWEDRVKAMAKRVSKFLDYNRPKDVQI